MALGISGDLNERLGYLNMMHKSFIMFQNMLAKKAQQVQTTFIKQKRFSPRMCILPSSMENLNLVVENFDLGKNYFDKN